MNKLTRTPEDKWLGGVCGGIADYTGIDTTIIRIGLVICTLLGAGSLVVAYLVAWLLIPRRTSHGPVPAQATDAPATGREPAQPSG